MRYYGVPVQTKIQANTLLLQGNELSASNIIKAVKKQRRYINLEKETKEYLKACEAKSIVNQTNIKTLNDYVINRKTRNLNTTFLANSPIVLNGLVLWLDAGVSDSYPAGGTAWKDLAGSNNGTLVNGPTFSSANRGMIQFNGSSQYATSIFANTSFTQLTFIAFFYRITTGSSGAGIVFNRGGGGNTTGMNICFPNSNTLGYHWNDDGGTYNYDSGLSIPLNAWSYCALSVNSASALFCVNNTFVNRIYSHASTSIGGGLQIGADPAAGRYYQSNFALAFIYNRALSQAEITQNYNATKGRFGL